MAERILILHGPNLNLLGTREPHIYGVRTLADIDRDLVALADSLGVSAVTFQSNHEGALVDRIQQTRQEGIDFLIINAGAYTHTSVAIRDAIAGVGLPCIEVHLSNVHRHESFRHHSYLSDIALGVVCGLGEAGYDAALRYAAHHT